MCWGTCGSKGSYCPQTPLVGPSGGRSLLWGLPLPQTPGLALQRARRHRGATARTPIRLAIPARQRHQSGCAGAVAPPREAPWSGLHQVFDHRASGRHGRGRPTASCLQRHAAVCGGF
eukprot:6935135-Alexandrium_andersonii.AAC.1